MKGRIIILLAGLSMANPALAQDVAASQTVRAAVLRVDVPSLPPISRLDAPPEDLGFAGARLAIEDNDTTGRFMNQDFEALEITATPESAPAEMDKLLAQGIPFIVTLADDAQTLALADQAGDRALVLNARARGDGLRGKDCRFNVIHAAPSHAMLADALAQFLMWKQWPNWFLIAGSHPEDVALAGLSTHRRGAVALGVALSILAVLAAMLIAQWISDPLHGLAEAMSALRTGKGAASGIDAVGGYREVRELAGTLTSLLGELARREAELQALAEALESRVADRTRELELANAALEQLSLTDPLTGLGNRRFFDEQLAREIEDARASGRSLALVCLDIDHFKAINDRHGHPVGDKVLALIARHLRDGLRPLDVLARTGGEEFCVIAPRTDLAGAMALAERLRTAVASASPLHIGRDRIEARLSGGVAMLGDVPEGLPGEVLAQRLYDRADQALYLAKRAGRNRVRYSPDPLA